MLVGRLHTYLAATSKGLVQKHIVSYFDPLPLEPASEKDLHKFGYKMELMDNGQFCLIHPEKGYLSLSPDPAVLEHSDTPTRDCYVRCIDPAILPPPPPAVTPQESIAKNIHQVWISDQENSPYLEKCKPNREALISLNPEYEYTFWNNAKDNMCENFIKEHYGEKTLEYYNAINPKYIAAKVDLFRYLCIYMLGGVYLDMKTTVAVPLHYIIKPEDRFLVSFQAGNWHWNSDIRYIKYGCEFQQYIIMCAAGHPLMKRIVHQVLCAIKLYDPDIQEVGQVGVFNTTGPVVYSRIIDTFRSYPTTRLFNAQTAGVDYNVLSHSEHYETLGDSHYSRQTTPVILDPDSL